MGFSTGCYSDRSSNPFYSGMLYSFRPNLHLDRRISRPFAFERPRQTSVVHLHGTPDAVADGLSISEIARRTVVRASPGKI